jgi:Na+-transporting NADH:ubiquinone oxidoreductase subunit NqrB
MASGLIDAFIGVLLLVGDNICIPLLFIKYLVGALLFYIPWDERNVKTYLQRITVINSIFSLETQ